MISIEASPTNLRNLAILDSLAKRIGISLRDITVHEARLAAYDLILSTPPLWTGKKNDANTAQRIGMEAVSRDVRMTTKDLSDKGQYKAWWVGKDGRLFIKRHDNKVAVKNPDRYDATGARVADNHASRRNSDTGYVYRTDPLYVQDGTERQRFIQSKWRKVGGLASGWLSASRHFSRLDRIVSGRGASSKLPPMFVVSAQGGNGSFTDAMTTRGGGFVSGTQGWRYGRPSKMQARIASVMRTRERDMGEILNKRLSKHVLDANSGLVVYRA